ncbi:hypothetical protein FOCC_FOCC011562 [Frankliniella occidentalis]|nr:hypothetical protein FOCC_FOCC011562 [Frankliniella occidentalis]
MTPGYQPSAKSICNLVSFRLTLPHCLSFLRNSLDATARHDHVTGVDQVDLRTGQEAPAFPNNGRTDNPLEMRPDRDEAAISSGSGRGGATDDRVMELSGPGRGRGTTAITSTTLLHRRAWAARCIAVSLQPHPCRPLPSRRRGFLREEARHDEGDWKPHHQEGDATMDENVPRGNATVPSEVVFGSAKDSSSRERFDYCSSP